MKVHAAVDSGSIPVSSCGGHLVGNALHRRLRHPRGSSTKSSNGQHHVQHRQAGVLTLQHAHRRHAPISFLRVGDALAPARTVVGCCGQNAVIEHFWQVGFFGQMGAVADVHLEVNVDGPLDVKPWVDAGVFLECEFVDGCLGTSTQTPTERPACRALRQRRSRK